MSDRRQALILIHGIGEQRPMETLRSFVDAVLDQQASTSQVDARYYSKPDFLSDNYELRRLVSARSRDDRTDFYEFYWAHLMPVAAWNRLAGWFWVLMYRDPRVVPGRIFPIWMLSWVTLILATLLGFQSGLRFLMGDPIAPGLLDKAPWFLLAVLGGISALIRSYVGDAAVYLSPEPANIEARQKIRAAGLDLLEKVMSSGRYDRVIVVGHSLGSVIGYDVLSLAWQKHFDAVRDRLSAAWASGERPAIASSAIRRAEVLAKAIRDAEPVRSTDNWVVMVLARLAALRPRPRRSVLSVQDKSADTEPVKRAEAGEAKTGSTALPIAESWDPVEAEARAADWRLSSRAVAEEQARNGDPWLVTDFVTLGSPLTYADLLLAKNAADFTRRTQERELPHCPPARELSGRFSFDHKARDEKGGVQEARVLNSAALFAVTAWTNLFFPSKWGLRGDFVGGAVAPLFWSGVHDVPVATRVWNGWLAHTHYWRRDKRDIDPETAPLTRLREALDLGRKYKWPSRTMAPAPVPSAPGEPEKRETAAQDRAAPKPRKPTRRATGKPMPDADVNPPLPLRPVPRDEP